MINQPKKKVVIIIPTYNEKENICFLLNQILTILNDFDLRILVVDDNSPDGTGQLVQSLSGQEPRIQILIRKGKRGRGTAGLVGFQKALEWKPDFVVEMDGDLSHQPQYLPNLLSQAEQNDIVIGSRFIAGGKDLDRGYLRKFITLVARNFARRWLQVETQDISSGYRCFRRQALEKLELAGLRSKGPSLVIEILYKAHLCGLKIKEVPIIFIQRKKGKSKLNLFILIQTLLMVFKFKKIYDSSSCLKANH